MNAPTSPSEPTFPAARPLRPQASSWSRMWWVTLASAVVAVVLVVQAQQVGGTRLQIGFRHGHGLEPGAAIRLKGIEVGRVESVTMAATLDRVVVGVRLMPNVASALRAGTQFWIERPQVGLAGVSGLETVVGAKYIALEPGGGTEPLPLQVEGLETPPQSLPTQEGVEFLLESPAKFGLQVGSPVLYRGVPIGVVAAIGLTSDARSVATTIRIDSPYRELIREDSVFWPVSGIDVRLGWSGVKLDTDSLTALAAGGIGVATPTVPGPVAVGGRRFELQAEGETEWLGWSPPLSVGTPGGASGTVPLAQRATFSGQRVRWGFTRPLQISCWVHPLEHGPIVVPAMIGDDMVLAERLVMEFQGEAWSLAATQLHVENGLGVITGLKRANAPSSPAATSQSSDRSRKRRVPPTPEDCLIVAGHQTLPLAQSRLTPGAHWSVDPSVELSQAWHGASVIARDDGAWIGILLWQHGQASIAPLTPELDSWL